MSLKAFKKWYEDQKDTVEFKVEHNKNEFAIELNRLMEDQGIKRIDLAARIERTPAYMTKVLRGDANLTIDTMTRFADAVGAELCLHLSPIGATTRWFDVFGANEEPKRSDEDEQVVNESVLAWVESSHREAGIAAH